MIEFDFDNLSEQKNFWIVASGGVYLSAGAIMLILEEFMLGIVFLGMAITFTAVAMKKLKEEE